MRLARTLVVLIALPCLILAATAGVFLAATTAALEMVGGLWRR